MILENLPELVIDFMFAFFYLVHGVSDHLHLLLQLQLDAFFARFQQFVLFLHLSDLVTDFHYLVLFPLDFVDARPQLFLDILEVHGFFFSGKVWYLGRDLSKANLAASVLEKFENAHIDQVFCQIDVAKDFICGDVPVEGQSSLIGQGIVAQIQLDELAMVF